MQKINRIDITKITTNNQIPGDIIHLLGYYPPNPTTTERPRPLYKPVYTYPKPSTTITTSNTNTFSHHTNQHTASSSSQHRPTWEHETNHISSSPSFYPLVHPDEHFGIIDEEGFGAEAEAAVFSHNTYGDFSNKPTTYADEEYRPFQGTTQNYNSIKKNFSLHCSVKKYTNLKI